MLTGTVRYRVFKTSDPTGIKGSPYPGAHEAASMPDRYDGAVHRLYTVEVASMADVSRVVDDTNTAIIIHRADPRRAVTVDVEEAHPDIMGLPMLEVYDCYRE